MPDNELPDIQMPEGNKRNYVPQPPISSGGSSGSYPRPAARRSSPSPVLVGCGAVLIIVAVACCVLPILFVGGFGTLAAVVEGNTVTERSTAQLAIQDADEITLVVTNDVGDIRIQGDDRDDIEVEIEKRASGLSDNAARDGLNDIQVDVRREGDRYIIETHGVGDNAELLENRSVALRIFVPERAMSITVTNNVGDVSLRDVVIDQQLDLSLNVGDLDFEGEISNGGEHRISLNVGDVGIQLDNDSNVALDAATDVGDISTDLVLRDLRRDEDGPASNLTATYGEAREQVAALRIRLNVGDITLED